MPISYCGHEDNKWIFTIIIMEEQIMRKKWDNKIVVKKIAAGVIAITIVAAGVFATKAVIRKIDTQKKHEQLVKLNEDGADAVNKLYLNMGDQKALVGSTIQVEAYVVPQTELASSVEFSSSDNNIFTVTQLGMITVNSEGKATLTAKTGNLAASIIIEGVTDKEQVASEAAADTLPKEYAGISGSATLKPQSANVVYDSSNNQASGDSEDMNVNGEDSIANNDNLQPNIDNVTPETEPDLPPEELQKVRDNIENYGFTKCQDSSYAIYNDGDYYGQVIVDAKAIYIGIKLNSDMTDEAFKNVLKTVLPDSYENCFSIYRSATNDRVMIMDNHKVNIMTGGDHTFINIYALNE